MASDYYEMLGVAIDVDRETLEKALEDRRREWSSGTRNPKYKHTYQSYLDRIPEIRKTLLGDPASRAAYDAELLAERRCLRDRKLDELQRLVRLRAAKGGLTVSDRGLLRDQADRLGLTPADLDPLLVAIPSKPEAPRPDDADEPDPARHALDAVTRRQIRTALDHLRKRDLYEAIGLNRDAPSSEIARRTDAERQRWMRKTQVTAEKTVWLEVVSYAQSHLTSPSSRSKYDRSLEIEAEEALEESIKFAINGLPTLDPATRQVLLEEAESRGVLPDRADKLIVRSCKSMGVARDGAVPTPTGLMRIRFLRCRACPAVTDFRSVENAPSEASCRQCKSSLRWDCPACRRVHWVDESRCPCGFAVEWREPLVKHFEAAQQAFRSHRNEVALEHLGRVLEFAPKHAAARKAIDRVTERIGAIEQVKSAFETAKAKRNHVSAKAAVTTWAKLVDPRAPELRAAWTEVTQTLREALAIAAKAKALEATDTKAARRLYRQSLDVVADLPEAREGLRRCPPDAPSNLSAMLEGGKVVLRWSAAPADGLGPVTYRVIRKRCDTPRHSGDGVAAGETRACEFKDASVMPGDLAGYAVYSVRGEAISTTGPASAPIAVLADVENVKLDVRSREIQLSWSLPRNALGVQVLRHVGPNGGDVPIEVRHDRAYDAGLEDDRPYQYRIVTLYRTPDGQSRASGGVIVSAVPRSPVEPVEAPLLIREHGGGVLLTWTRPSRGVVRVIRTPRALPQEPGDRLSPEQAEALEGVWLDSTLADQARDPSPPSLGLCHYTPLTFFGGDVTVGREIRYSSVPDPSDLRAVRIGGKVHLRWKWSPQGTLSAVSAKRGGPPRDPNDSDAISVTVLDSDYSRQGYYALNLPQDGEGPWHIAVFSITTIDGARIVSPGLDPTARTIVPGPNPEVTVTYAIKRPMFPGRPWSVNFQTEPPGAAIPATALVVHARAVPLSPDDGDIVDRFPAARDGATFQIRPSVNLTSYRVRVFADPRSDPDTAYPVRFRHPDAEAARV